MMAYKYNEFTGKYYHYDMDDYDFFSPMFDETLHCNEWDVPTEYKKSKTCWYCNTTFKTRNQLFYHLGYHGINVNPAKAHDDDMACEGEDVNYGDYGVIYAAKKKKSFRKWVQKRNMKKIAKVKRKKELAMVLEKIQNINL